MKSYYRIQRARRFVCRAFVMLVAFHASAGLAPAATDNQDEVPKLPLTRLFELPGRMYDGMGAMAGRLGDAAKGGLDKARDIRDEIYRDGIGKYFGRRAQRMADGGRKWFEGWLRTAGDLAHGRAAQVAADPGQADEANAARRRAAVRFGEAVRDLNRTVNGPIAPAQEAGQLLTNPDPFARTKLLKEWLDASARTLVSEIGKSGKATTKRDFQLRVKERLREKIQRLPPEARRMANMVLDRAVSTVVDKTYATAVASRSPSSGSSAPPAALRPQPLRPSASTSAAHLSGASRWDDGQGNKACNIAVVIDVGAQRFTMKVMHGVYRKLAHQTFSGQFDGKYRGDATHGTLEGSGMMTVRWRDSQTGRSGSSPYRFGLKGTLDRGVVRGYLTFNGEISFRHAISVR